MVRASLPPGFRFHPTDVELVMYYLKRKVLGKKLPFEAISELNIYQFSPQDLPDKSCLKTKDLVWYFFCPRERKYASGSRTKRATETGYWKATGKDRQVLYKGKGVGMVKTLVFHTGSAPNGERTDWVIHEYRIEDKDLADKGVALDTYVLCKLFHKNGRGPKNGAQYGAPFQEEDWDDDSEIHVDSLSHDGLSPLVPALQQKQNASALLSVVDLGQSSGLSLSEPGPPVICPSVDDVLFYGQNDSVLTSTDPATARSSPQNDEIMHLLRFFSEDEVVYLDEGEKVKSLPNSDGSDPFNGLEDLSNLAEHNGSGHNNFSDAAFLELDDLDAPLNFSTESCVGEIQTGGFESCGVEEIQACGLYPCKFTGSGNVLTGSLCTNYNTNGDLWQFCYQNNFPNDEPPPTDFLQLPKVPSASDHPRNSTNVFPMGNFCDGRIPAFYLDWTSYKHEEMGNAAGRQERGVQSC